MFRFVQTMRAKLAKNPFVANCIYYGTLFCGAEVAQQIVLKKYQPWSQVIYSLSLMEVVMEC